MSIDKLHEKIRKLKNPSVIDFGIKPDRLPPHLLEEGELPGYVRFCNELMGALKETVPAVRFPFGAFALYGPEGLAALQGLLKRAGELGFYVLLDSPEILSPWAADRTAQLIFEENAFICDGLIIGSFIGSDGVKPFLPYCKDGSKALFVVVRSPNKSASELQDLLTGTRLVHVAASEMVNRFGETILAKCGYSRVGIAASAGAPDSLRNLRTRHNRMFLLVDGLDYPSGNAKNCSFAFDRFGYGAAVCAGPSITAAWKIAETDGKDYVAQAQQAAERMKKNITRYITIL
jgi:orotidine-5'-phosphate decarboxylase